MTESRKEPRIDLTGPYLFLFPTAFSKDGEKHDYLIRGYPSDPNTEELLIRCHSEMQLTMVYNGMKLDPEKNEDTQVQDALWHISGRLMSQRVFKEDFYQSGRENMGYELVWLPGGVFEKISRALEHAEEYGLSALMREGRVKT